MNKDKFGESKVQMKQKANQFIVYYERLVKQRQFQKQKIKQNVMIQIMSNKQKSEYNSNGLTERQAIINQKSELINVNSEYKFVGSFRKGTDRINSRELQTDVDLQQRKDTQRQFLRSSSMPQDGMLNKNNTQNIQTNNMDIDNKYREITFKKTIDINRFNQESQKQYPHDNQSNLQYITFKNSNVIKKTSNVKNQSLPLSQQQLPSIKRKSIKNQSLQNQQLHNQSLKSSQYQQEKEDFNNSKENHNNIFITVNGPPEDQQEEEEKTKNISFDIIMEKSDIHGENVEELKKKKIEELNKRRQQRLDEAKRNNLEKQVSKGKDPFSGKHSQSNIQDQNEELPNKKKYLKPQTTKVLPGRADNSSLNDLTQHTQESHYQIKPQNIRSTYHHAEVPKINKAKQQRQLSPNINTPKTTFTSKNKLPVKGTPFVGQSPSRDRSASRIQQGKSKTIFSKQSNRKLMITAINYVCLPGELNRKERQKLIEVIQNQEAQFFIFLFKQYSRKVIKGIYVMDPNLYKVSRIYGQKAPIQLFSEQIHDFYRFDSGSRQFKKLDGCKSFSLAVHAVDSK